MTKTIKQINTQNCQIKYPEKFQACEDIKPLKMESKSFLVLACSHDVTARMKWYPPITHFDKNFTGNIRDHFFMYDINGDLATQLEIEDFPADADLVLHGFDFARDGDKIIIYAVNHRRSGSVIERFSHQLGSNTLKYEKTFDGTAVVPHPNSVTVVDHKTNAFYISNVSQNLIQILTNIQDHLYKQGLMREIETTTQRKWSHIAFHSDKTGFKIAYNNLVYPNGIIAKDGKLYLSTCTGGSVLVFKINSDFSLTFEEEIFVGFILDNLTISTDGNIITAGHPSAFEFLAHVKNISVSAPSMAAKIFVKKQEPRYEIIFSDKLGLMNASTGATEISDNGGSIFFISGLLSKGLLRCDN
jgi:arylesterase/paraoxonase